MTRRRPRLGVLLSGSGRTLQNLLDRIAAGRLDAEVACVVADRASAFGLQRAAAANVPHAVAPPGEATWRILREHDVDLVCLCGYLRLLPIDRSFQKRVLNIHPALLPRHGGRGMFGDAVHAAVLAAGDAESGCTVHLCDDEYDHGTILLQQRVPVLPGDTVATLAARVFAAECEAYPRAIGEHWERLQRER